MLGNEWARDPAEVTDVTGDGGLSTPGIYGGQMKI